MNFSPYEGDGTKVVLLGCYPVALQIGFWFALFFYDSPVSPVKGKQVGFLLEGCEKKRIIRKWKLKHLLHYCF